MLLCFTEQSDSYTPDFMVPRTATPATKGIIIALTILGLIGAAAYAARHKISNWLTYAALLDSVSC
jgi:hypothetical protein